MKKTLSLLIAAAILCSLFSSCSSKRESDTENNSVQRDLIITMDSHYADMDDSAVRAYEKIIDAVLNYKKEIKFNISLIDSVNQLFYTSPFYALVESISFLQDNTGIEIHFKYDETEHKKLIDDFKSKIDNIMTQCGYGTVSNDMYVLNVYSYVAGNVSVDNAYTTIFETVIHAKGVNAAVSGMFEYLLHQASVPACHIMNINGSGISNPMSMAKFKGEWYYFNPADEIIETAGKGLVCFAMNTKRAQKRYGSDQFVYTDQTAVEELEDDTFSKLSDARSYKMEGKKVIVHLASDDDFTFEC